MNRTILEYLQQPAPRRWPGNDVPWKIPVTPTRLQILAALVAMNTGGWGIITGGGPYGRTGLEMEESIELMKMQSFVTGWLSAREGPDETEALNSALKAEWDRVETMER